MRNTQTQFLRMCLPDEANVWSVMVKGKVVKPARDGEGRLMVCIPPFFSFLFSFFSLSFSFSLFSGSS